MGEWFLLLIACFARELCVEFSRPILTHALGLDLGLFGSVFQVLLGELCVYMCREGPSSSAVLVQDLDGSTNR